MLQDEFKFLTESGPILCLDIGSGTQDVLLARPHMTPENWPRFVIPAPARMVAERIYALTESKQHIWLYGYNMGGGFFRSLKAHLDEGFAVSCTQSAAAALHDDIARVQAMGIDICEHAPKGAVPVFLADYSPTFWQHTLQHLGLPLPNMVLAAAQDHGIHLEGNRLGRMLAWRKLLKRSHEPEQWLYTNVPTELTRLATIQQLSGGPMADTGTAAILGALCAPEVRERSWREGVTIINVGNSHIVAALVYKAKVYAIFEHHTGQRTLDEYLHDLKEFRLGWLPDEQVRLSGGHGTAFGQIPEDAGSFAPTYLLGPQREFLQGHGQCIAPHGDMMLAGCFGLLRGYIHACTG